MRILAYDLYDFLALMDTFKPVTCKFLSVYDPR